MKKTNKYMRFLDNFDLENPTSEKYLFENNVEDMYPIDVYKELEKQDLIMPYMSDVLNDISEYTNGTDFIKDIFMSTVMNEDMELVKRFTSTYDINISESDLIQSRDTGNLMIYKHLEKMVDIDDIDEGLFDAFKKKDENDHERNHKIIQKNIRRNEKFDKKKKKKDAEEREYKNSQIAHGFGIEKY